jgi:outer membrane protein TolC
MMFLMLAGPAQAADFSVTLKDAESSALETSDQYRGARLSAEAASAGAAAAGSLLYPRLSLEGSLRYNSVVTEINLPPAMGGARPLGDNWNYSIGPTASWTLYDGGALRYGRQGAERNASARSADAEAARRQTVLAARTAYFRLQLALEKVYLIGENLQLSLNQFKDVSLGAKAGSRSRLDELRAEQDTLDRKRDLLRARGDLSAALRDLGYVTGLPLPGDPALPLDYRMAGRDYGGVEPATMFVKADPYDSMLGRLLPAADGGLDKDLPAVKALDEAARAYKASAGAYGSALLPRLTLGARSSIDYPNGPNLYSFLQNSASLALSLPLFEKDLSRERQKENEFNAEAALRRRNDAEQAAGRDFSKARDAYRELIAEQAVNIEAVDDAVEAGRLAYASYLAGGSTWLDVESANLKTLQAKTTAATANAEILMKLAVLDSLNGR